jgi:hypothetical protein
MCVCVFACVCVRERTCVCVFVCVNVHFVWQFVCAPLTGIQSDFVSVAVQLGGLNPCFPARLESFEV